MMRLSGKNDGFTLIELLVVISIIALLVAILMPALNKAREQATGAVCLGNQKSLSMAWLMYADENNGHLIGGSTYAATENRWCEPPKISDRYAGDPPSGSANDYVNLANVTNVRDMELYRKNGIRAGRLFDYLETVDVYQCPGDKSWTKFNPPLNKFRSYSISGAMNGEDAEAGSQNGRKAYERMSQINRPSEKYVFVEETHKGQVFLQGSFMVHTGGFFDPDSPGVRFWDNISKWHNYRNTFSFVDGHAEIKEWSDKRTREFMDTQTSISGAAAELGVEERYFSHSGGVCDNDDFIWLFRGYGQVGR